jgi:molybdopterin converting factor small subunit
LAAGCAAEAVDFGDSSSVRDLLEELSRRHGRPMAALLEFKERAAPAVLVFVGDEQVQWDAPRGLRDSDEVMIIAPISGG